MGWAIEGAIGSTFKIDASYLSPHVNIASRLEAATKQYGVPLLISDHLHRFFSPRFQAISRKIDCVTLKGSQEPLSLYTFDLCVDDLPPSKIKENITRDQQIEIGYIKKNAFLDGIDIEEIHVEDVLDHDKAMKMLLKNFNISFHEMFKEAMECYLSGDWIKSIDKFEKAIAIKGDDDGPSKAILNFVMKTGGVKPEDWKGFRELTEK